MRSSVLLLLTDFCLAIGHFCAKIVTHLPTQRGGVTHCHKIKSRAVFHYFLLFCTRQRLWLCWLSYLVGKKWFGTWSIEETPLSSKKRAWVPASLLSSGIIVRGTQQRKGFFHYYLEEGKKKPARDFRLLQNFGFRQLFVLRSPLRKRTITIIILEKAAAAAYTTWPALLSTQYFICCESTKQHLFVLFVLYCKCEYCRALERFFK